MRTQKVCPVPCSGACGAAAGGLPSPASPPPVDLHCLVPHNLLQDVARLVLLSHVCRAAENKKFIQTGRRGAGRRASGGGSNSRAGMRRHQVYRLAPCRGQQANHRACGHKGGCRSRSGVLRTSQRDLEVHRAAVLRLNAMRRPPPDGHLLQLHSKTAATNIPSVADWEWQLAAAAAGPPAATTPAAAAPFSASLMPSSQSYDDKGTCFAQIRLANAPRSRWQ